MTERSTQTGAALTDRFSAAVEIARQLHSAQVRKGTQIPYLSHLLAVASLVIENGGDEDQAIAGLLHDAVEDAGGPPTLAAIRSRFGDRVADIVAACSDTDEDPKPPWLDRKRRYLAHLEDAPNDVLLVSLADKVHNARSLAADATAVGASLWDRFNASKEESAWYYRSLLDVFRRRLGTTPLVRELDIAVASVWGAHT